MALLELHQVGKSFKSEGAETMALDGIDLALAERGFLAVVGPSGCGKSTLLQIAAGLIRADRGSVELSGQPVTAPPPHVVYVFQQYTKSLFPWRTVLANVEFALEGRSGIGRRERRDRSRSLLELVDLQDFTDHYPWQLSGGMQQRVAIARALAADARLLLMDEPFSALDALTRLDLQRLLLDLWASRICEHSLRYRRRRRSDLSCRLGCRAHASPGRIHEIVDVALPRPRDPITTREETRFLQLRHDLLGQLMKRKN